MSLNYASNTMQFGHQKIRSIRVQNSDHVLGYNLSITYTFMKVASCKKLEGIDPRLLCSLLQVAQCLILKMRFAAAQLLFHRLMLTHDLNRQQANKGKRISRGRLRFELILGNHLPTVPTMEKANSSNSLNSKMDFKKMDCPRNSFHLIQAI